MVSMPSRWCWAPRGVAGSPGAQDGHGWRPEPGFVEAAGAEVLDDADVGMIDGVSGMSPLLRAVLTGRRVGDEPAVRVDGDRRAAAEDDPADELRVRAAPHVRLGGCAARASSRPAVWPTSSWSWPGSSCSSWSSQTG